jgi:diguanylate cyclase (GGDEF)-like protein/PAS domain S-box-containing protein
MLEAPIPVDEEERLATLRGLHILDTPPEERFDRLTRLAQHILDTPIAAISLIDSDRRWMKSCQGQAATNAPRSITFCGHAIIGNETFVIPDATLDPRFSDNPLVTGAPHIRFYAGQPLKAINGSRLGTLCIIDKIPRQPSHADLNVLRDLAAVVENELNFLDIVKTQDVQLRENEAILSATINTTLDAVVHMDSDGIITHWNTQAEKIFGWPRAEAVGRMLHETIIPPQYREAHLRGMKHFLISGEETVLSKRIEMTALRRNGQEFPVELSITPLKIDGKYKFSAFIRDITERKRSEDTIWKQANFDTLTGLPNRDMFHDRLEQEAMKSLRAGLPLALLLIDLDQFKEVNDTLGHVIGDNLLQEAARRIRSCVRESDTVARLGGDEFTVVLSELDDYTRCEDIAQNIVNKLAESYHLGNELIYVSASIGITLYPNDATNIDTLIQNADQAMYVAKKHGRNRFSYFTPALQQAAQSRLRLANDLRVALAGEQFRVYFQPIVELSSGNIHKAEALLRWQHPERGMVDPMEFIPVAEETGLIIDIGDWVFKEAARWIKHWNTQFTDNLQISVNKSPAEFAGRQVSVNVSPGQFKVSSSVFTDKWLHELKKLGLTGKSIVVEITEGLLLNTEADILKKLLKLRDAGIQVAIDDFGTGYSSLAYLKKFDIDYLKIDQTFVHNLETDTNNAALTEAIIVMAHKLGLKVIAEGVETEGQLKLLADVGCDYAQGYLFSEPVPPEEFEKLLMKS